MFSTIQKPCILNSNNYSPALKMNAKKLCIKNIENMAMNKTKKNVTTNVSVKIVHMFSTSQKL